VQEGEHVQQDVAAQEAPLTILWLRNQQKQGCHLRSFLNFAAFSYYFRNICLGINKIVGVKFFSDFLVFYA
jgi:hypothetical protein